jgi:hypothetical protein
MLQHKPGKVVVLFGNFPLTIRLPPASQDEQLNFLRKRIIFHVNSLVEYGLWDEALSDAELDEIMSDVEIESVFFPNFSSAWSWWRYPLRILTRGLGTGD